MVPIHGTGKFFQHLRYYLPPIPTTCTTIKILKLCTILLCSTQHFLIQKIKKSHFDFQPTKKNTNEHYSNQSPLLKFSPSNCLQFLFNIFQQNLTISELKSHLYNHTPISLYWPYCFFGCNNQQNYKFALLTLCVLTTAQK